MGEENPLDFSTMKGNQEVVTSAQKSPMRGGGLGSVGSERKTVLGVGGPPGSF